MRDLSPILPSSIEVVFRSRRCYGNVTNQNDVPPVYKKTVDISDITFSNSDVNSQTQGNGFPLTLRSTALALYPAANGDPSNKDALDTLAEKIAQDWYDWQSGPRFDRLYNGVVVPQANGIADFMEISQDESAIVTRYRTTEWNDYPTDFQQNDGPNNANCKDNLTANPPVDVAKTPYVQFASPLAKCVNGQVKVPICKIGLEAGRLVLIYVRTDTVSQS